MQTRIEKLETALKNDEVNDLQAMGIANQLMRERRIETWDAWKDKILTCRKVVYYEEVSQQGKWSLTIYNMLGDDYVIDYYPKANKVLIRKDNKWHKPGLNWLIENLLK